jgi:uracil phosphoribosyltransferase
VEDRNGKIKSFGALNKTIQNKMLPHIMNDVRISAALINCFYDLPKSDSNDDIVIVEEMLKKPYKKNDLIKYLKMKTTINKNIYYVWMVSTKTRIRLFS